MLTLETLPTGKTQTLSADSTARPMGTGDWRRRTVNVGARRWKLPVWPLLFALAAGCDAGTVAVEPDPLPPPGQWEANPRPVTVAVGPLTATLSAVGDTLRLTARVADQYGQALTVPVAWAVDQPGVAAVDSAGLVTARRNGRAVVTATAGGVSGSATVTVAPGA